LEQILSVLKNKSIKTFTDNRLLKIKAGSNAPGFYKVFILTAFFTQNIHHA